MNIAQVLTGSTGGIGRHVASVAVRMVAAGHQVRVFCPEDTDRAHQLSALGLAVRPLRDLARWSEVDLVHAHGYKAGARALPVTRLRRRPLVVTWHNEVLRAPGSRGMTFRAGRMLQRLVAVGATLTLGASGDLVDRARQLGARRAELAPVAAPALPAPLVSRSDRRAELDLAAGELMVLTVGRLAPQKNLGLVLDLAASAAPGSEVPALRFVVVGEGPERARLEARIRAEKLPVELPGATADIASWWAAADLALLTSTWEARALVAQEALLAGVPLISPRLPGIEELVGTAAAFFPPGSAEGARTRLVALASDPAARQRLSEHGRRQAQRWPDEDDVAAALLRRYAEVVAGGRGVS